jgi:hypothetical protein
LTLLTLLLAWKGMITEWYRTMLHSPAKRFRQLCRRLIKLLSLSTGYGNPVSSLSIGSCFGY